MPKFQTMHQPTAKDRAAIARQREIARSRASLGAEQIVPLKNPDRSDPDAAARPQDPQDKKA